jgi:hypothetical protein
MCEGILKRIASRFELVGKRFEGFNLCILPLPSSLHDADHNVCDFKLFNVINEADDALNGENILWGHPDHFTKEIDELCFCNGVGRSITSISEALLQARIPKLLQLLHQTH